MRIYILINNIPPLRYSRVSNLIIMGKEQDMLPNARDLFEIMDAK